MGFSHRAVRCGIGVVGLLVCLGSVFADEPANPSTETASEDPEAIAFFENKIRPLLAENCYECHGREEQESGLRVDSLAGLFEGG